MAAIQKFRWSKGRKRNRTPNGLCNEFYKVQRKAILIGMAALAAFSVVLFLRKSNGFFVASIIFFGGLIQVPGNLFIGLQLRLFWIFFLQSGGRLPVAARAAHVEVPLPGHYLGQIGQKNWAKFADVWFSPVIPIDFKLNAALMALFRQVMGDWSWVMWVMTVYGLALPFHSSIWPSLRS